MRFILVIGIFLASAVNQAMATDLTAAAELAKASGCTSCHAAKEKVVGPAFSSIAEKYADDKDASASLAQSIKNGSKGKWGRIPMPPHPSLSAEDLKTMADWVMSTKP